MYFMLVLFLFLAFSSADAADPEAEHFLHKAPITPPRALSCMVPESYSFYDIKRCDSDSFCGIKNVDKHQRRPSLFEKMFKKKDLQERGFSYCNDLHDEVRINIFKAEVSGKEEYLTRAAVYLAQLQDIMQSPKASFHPRLEYRVPCYNRLLKCGPYKGLRNYQDEYDLAIEGCQLVRSIYNKAQKKDAQLFSHIEEILGVCATIYARKAETEYRSMEWLAATLRAIHRNRSQRLSKGIPFVSIINVNEFAHMVHR